MWSEMRKRGKTETKGIQRESREGILEDGALERWLGIQKERRHRYSVCCHPEAEALTKGL